MANNGEKQLRFKDFYKIAQTLKNLDSESLRQGSGLNGVIVLGQGTLGNLANRLESLADGFQYRMTNGAVDLGSEVNSDVEKRYHEMNVAKERAYKSEEIAAEAKAKYDDLLDKLNDHKKQLDLDIENLEKERQMLADDREQFEKEKADFESKISTDPVEANDEQAFDHAEDTRLDSNMALKKMEDASDDDKVADVIINGSMAAEGSGEQPAEKPEPVTTDDKADDSETAEESEDDEDYDDEEPEEPGTQADNGGLALDLSNVPAENNGESDENEEEDSGDNSPADFTDEEVAGLRGSLN